MNYQMQQVLMYTFTYIIHLHVNLGVFYVHFLVNVYLSGTVHVVHQTSVTSYLVFGIFNVNYFQNTDASRIVNHTLEFASPVRGVRIYPWEWEFWICLRTELYGIYLSNELCANLGQAEGMSRSCVGDRDCGLNAECKLPHASKMQKKGTTR